MGVKAGRSNPVVDRFLYVPDQTNPLSRLKRTSRCSLTPTLSPERDGHSEIMANRLGDGAGKNSPTIGHYFRVSVSLRGEGGGEGAPGSSLES